MKKSRPDSVDYLDGLAVHWYWDEMVGPENTMDKAREEMPDKIILTTESCIGDKPWQKAGIVLGSWERGEKYARAFLQDLQHGFNGWIDWNLVLDENGGPNYVDNTVDAPMVVNMTSRRFVNKVIWHLKDHVFDISDTNELLKQPMFYTMGHFSKFVPEGSIRIEVERSNVNVDTIAFLRPDGTVAIIIFNRFVLTYFIVSIKY